MQFNMKLDLKLTKLYI